MLSSMSKEKKIVVLVMVLYIIGALLGIVYYFARSLVSGGSMSDQGMQAILFLFFRFFIVMAILTELNKGKNWARIVLIVSAFLSTISYLMNSPIILVNLSLGLMSIAITVFYLLSALILLISKSAKGYFNMTNETKAN